MPGDLIAEVAGGVLRVVGRVLAEVFINLGGEVAIQGVGYMICKPFKPDVKPGGWLVAVVGLAFWVAVGALAYLAYRELLVPAG